MNTYKIDLSKVVLGTYEFTDSTIETERITERLSNITNIGWLDTAISYNNDDLLPKRIIDYDNYKIISKISPHMYPLYEELVDSHLKFLMRDEIDIMLIHNPRHENWKELALKMFLDTRFVEIGVSNFGISELKEFRNVTGGYPEYNEIEINPLYFDKELIDYCEEKGIKIIAYAILGGKYNALTNISKFTLPTLISFARKFSDMIIMRVDTLNQLDQFLLSTQPVKIDERLFKENLNLKSINPTSYLPTQFGMFQKGSEYFPVYEKYGFDELLDLDKVKFNKVESDFPNIIQDIFHQTFEVIRKVELEFITDYQYILKCIIKTNLENYNIYSAVYSDKSGYYIQIGSNWYTLSIFLIKDNNLTKVKDKDTEVKILISKTNYRYG